MKKVNVTCPSCSGKGMIEIDEILIEKNERGIASLNVSESLICPHSFVAYIDRNYTMRDAFVADFMIELPHIKIKEEKNFSDIELMNHIDMYLLRINLNADELVQIINCILMKKSVLLIKESEIVFDHISNLIKFIFLNTYEYNLSIKNRATYRNNRKLYKNYVIIGTDHFLSQKNKEKNFSKTKIEGAIVRKFLSEQDPKSALIIFKNEINKSHIMSRSIIELLQNYQNEKKISKKKLVDFLSKEYEIKMQFEYLEFLLNIVKNYFKFNLSGLSDYFFPSFGL